MIVAIIALVKGEVVVVQTSLIGSILSNLLLVMGMCFFFGGLKRKEQFFNQTVAQTAASLLALAVASVIIPTAFDQWSNTTEAPIAAISRGTSVILLVVYGGYLFFQLKTHSAMFNEKSKKVALNDALPQGAIAKGLAKAGGIGAGPGRAKLADRPPNDELILSTAYEDQPEEAEEQHLHILVAWATLAGATAIIGLCAGICSQPRSLELTILTNYRIHGRRYRLCGFWGPCLRGVRGIDLTSNSRKRC